MTDDDSWIALSAAAANVRAWMHLNKKATSEAGEASEVAVSEAAGVQLTEGGNE